MKFPDKQLTQTVRTGLEKLCVEFSEHVSVNGFCRTKKMFWMRRRLHTVDFIHFHRGGSSYGSPINASVRIRVHFGIRILNDSFIAAALNGPFSDPETLRQGNYHLRFNAQSGDSFERCLNDLVRFVVEQGEPWFQRFAEIESLLALPDSPLNPEEKLFLQDAVMGQPTKENLTASLKVLGIKA